VHAVGLFRGRKKALLGNGWSLNSVKAVFPTGSVPRLYNQEKSWQVSLVCSSSVEIE
jgi:hypothetical protein